MEKEINIAAILKDKSDDVKLYDSIRCISVNYKWLGSKSGSIHCVTGNHEVVYEKNGSLLGYPKGMQILKPSKDMQDWSKFTWKKGDVLKSNDTDSLCIFDSFEDDTYITFNCKFYHNPLDFSFNINIINRATEPFAKVDDDSAKDYINKLEEHYGGKLNLSTLEIEKPEPEFKDGDVVVMERNETFAKAILILKDVRCDGCLGYYAFVNCSTCKAYFNSAIPKDNREIRLATDSEKQQLFAALEKEGKRWNAESKTLEDLPKKCELQPFDKVLKRDTNDEIWSPGFFAEYDKNCTDDYLYGVVSSCCGIVYYKQCIPYNEETKHLLGTTDEWKGGEE